MFDNQGMGIPAELSQRIRPASMARERLLPVAPALESLLPDAGLCRGTCVQVMPGAGGLSLALALVSAASAAGSWVAVLGSSGLGAAAAAEFGVDLGRFALVGGHRVGQGSPARPKPPMSTSPEVWTKAASALFDAVDVVVLRLRAHGSGGLRRPDASRLAARARDRGVAVVALGDWSEAAEVRIRIESCEWAGLDNGGGHLRARRAEAVSELRRGATRRLSLWLPGADGQVSLAQAQPESLRPAGQKCAGRIDIGARAETEAPDAEREEICEAG